MVVLHLGPSEVKLMRQGVRVFVDALSQGYITGPDWMWVDANWLERFHAVENKFGKEENLAKTSKEGEHIR